MSVTGAATRVEQPSIGSIASATANATPRSSDRRTLGGALLGDRLPHARMLFMGALIGAVLAVIAVLFLALSSIGHGAVPRRPAARPGQMTRFTAGALLTAGTFTFTYWVISVPAAFGMGWWPSLPWN